MWELYFVTLVFALYFCNGIEKQIKTDFYQITGFKKSKNMNVEKNLRVVINFNKE